MIRTHEENARGVPIVLHGIQGVYAGRVSQMEQRGLERLYQLGYADRLWADNGFR